MKFKWANDTAKKCKKIHSLKISEVENKLKDFERKTYKVQNCIPHLNEHPKLEGPNLPVLMKTWIHNMLLNTCKYISVAQL